MPAVARFALFVFTLVAASAAEPAVVPDTRALEAWLARQPSIRSLEAGFTQERRLPTLKQPIVTPGRVAMQRPDKLRWELGEPAATIAVSDGVKLTLIDVAAKAARRMDADSPQAREFTLLAGEAFRDISSFRKAFEIEDQRANEGVHQYTLRPLDRRLRAKMPRLILEIDAAAKELRAIELELADRSRIRSVFHAVKINPPMDATRFQPSLEGFKVAG